MDTNVYKVIQELFKQGDFKSKFKIIPASIVRDVKLQKTFVADFEILFEKLPIALIEVKSKLVVPKKTADKFKHDVNIFHKRYIITDGVRLQIFDISKNSSDENLLYRGTDFSKIMEFLSFVNDPPKSVQEIESEIIIILQDLITKLLEFKNERLKYEESNNQLTFTPEQIRLAISINHDLKGISASDNEGGGQNLEYILFDLLLDDPWEKEKGMGKEKLLYRYTTFDAIFSTLKFLNYRLNGIQGMNDQKEGLTILKEFYNDENLIEDTYEKNKRLNEVFISSCTNVRDNLTMWRLYGDNSKGASITIKVDDSRQAPFFVKTISYIRPTNDKITKTISFAISRIKELGYKLDTRVFSLIPFFIKTNHYDVEREIRILFDKAQHYFPNKLVSFEWGISDPYKIVRPFVDIKLLDVYNGEKEHNSFLPFRITEVLLGPNCPHDDKNVIQIRNMIEELGLNDINVNKSKIDRDTYIG